MFTSRSSNTSSNSGTSPASFEFPEIEARPRRPKIIIITGACSGIGLSLAHRLSIRGNCRLILADISPAGPNLARSLAQQYSNLSRPIFVHTDVAIWEDQVKLFKIAAEAGNGIIDVYVANAGIADSDDLLKFDEPVPAGFASGQKMKLSEPSKPDLRTFDVDLNGILYGIKLFTYHARLANANTKQKHVSHIYQACGRGEPVIPKKIVITSSIFGLYPSTAQPLYAAAKHAITGLVRSFAPQLLKQENICISAICPSFVETSLSPDGLVSLIRRNQPAALTEMGVIMRAFDRLLEDRPLATNWMDNRQDSSDSDSISDASMMSGDSTPRQKRVLSGVICEISGNQLYDRNTVEYPDASTRWVVEDPLRIWQKAYGRPPDGVSAEERQWY